MGVAGTSMAIFLCAEEQRSRQGSQKLLRTDGRASPDMLWVLPHGVLCRVVARREGLESTWTCAQRMPNPSHLRGHSLRQLGEAEARYCPAGGMLAKGRFASVCPMMSNGMESRVSDGTISSYFVFSSLFSSYPLG